MKIFCYVAQVPKSCQLVLSASKCFERAESIQETQIGFFFLFDNYQLSPFFAMPSYWNVGSTFRKWI